MTNSRSIYQPAVAILEELGWKTVECRAETFGPSSTLGRETKGDVVLVDHVREALESLNPQATDEELGAAIEELVRDRSRMDLVAANREVHLLLTKGYKAVSQPGESGEGRRGSLVRYIDWGEPRANDFLFASQLGVTGETAACRCDLVGFVNGVPFVVVALENTHRDLEEAFGRTVAEYERIVPRLFSYNAFSIISNGDESRVGPIAAAWEHFGRWSRAESEEDAPWPSLETVLRGTCERARLLDLVESSLLFVETVGGPAKMMAKNHQYLGVNAALESLKDLAVNEGRLGMFWHAPGNGKGVSMILFVQKVLRKLPGAWTFVVVTDREELEQQAYGRMAAAGLVRAKVRAENMDDLGRLLSGPERYVFVRIQDFRAEEPDEQCPRVSNRSDIVVLAEEAHRPQYDALASNMRVALPNAAFIGFTSTPLLAGEDAFRRVLGDYVSIYNFRESVQDGITVPLYHENRLPEVQIAGGGLDKGLEQLLQEAELDGAAEARLESDCGRRYYAITDDERLDMVARDIMRHFTGRGYPGKALVVSIDRVTAVRMCEKVRASWSLQLAGMRLQLETAGGYGASDDPDGSNGPDRRVAHWQETDMAVLMTVSVDEVEDLRRKGVDVSPHVERARSEDLLARFNDPADPLRLVFTSADWISGIDTPTCSTIYLDKPMRDHVLLQTLGRANRRFRHKVHGLVVDYIGVFGDPRRSLVAYTAGTGGGVAAGDLPVSSKSLLMKDLRRALSVATGFLRDTGCDPEAIRQAREPTKHHLVDSAVDGVVATDGRKEEFLALARHVLQLYRAVVPDPLGEALGAECALFGVMIKRIRGLTPELGMSALERRLVLLVEDAMEAEGYLYRPPAGGAPEQGVSSGVRRLSSEDAALFGPDAMDLAHIDFDAVCARFPRTHKNTEIMRLRGAIEGVLDHLVGLNPTREPLRDEYEGFLEESEEGRIDADALFARLMDLVQKIDVERARGAQEGLSEEELALFDLLAGPVTMIGEMEGGQVKATVRGLLGRLKGGALTVGWRHDRQARAAVRLAIEEALGSLPGVGAPAAVARGADLIFQHVYDSYAGGGRSVYARP